MGALTGTDIKFSSPPRGLLVIVGREETIKFALLHCQRPKSLFLQRPRDFRELVYCNNATEQKRLD